MISRACGNPVNGGQKFAECSKGSILQYFQPSLSYHLSIRSMFCLILSGCFTQVLQFLQIEWKSSKKPASLRPKIGFKDRLSLNAGQLSTFIKLPFVI